MLLTIERHSMQHSTKIQVNTDYVEYVEQVRGSYTFLAIHMSSGKVIEAALTMEDWLRLTKQGA